MIQNAIMHKSLQYTIITLKIHKRIEMITYIKTNHE